MNLPTPLNKTYTAKKAKALMTPKPVVHPNPHPPLFKHQPDTLHKPE